MKLRRGSSSAWILIVVQKKRQNALFKNSILSFNIAKSLLFFFGYLLIAMAVVVMAGVGAKAGVVEAGGRAVDAEAMEGVSNARYVYGVLNAGDASFEGPLFFQSLFPLHNQYRPQKRTGAA